MGRSFRLDVIDEYPAKDHLLRFLELRLAATVAALAKNRSKPLPCKFGNRDWLSISHDSSSS
jgi:hypothetical protein